MCYHDWKDTKPELPIIENSDEWHLSYAQLHMLWWFISICCQVYNELLTYLHAGTECSVCWASDGKHLAIGTSAAEVQIWDSGAQKLVSNEKHRAFVCSVRVELLAYLLMADAGSPNVAFALSICVHHGRPDDVLAY